MERVRTSNVMWYKQYICYGYLLSSEAGFNACCLIQPSFHNTQFLVRFPYVAKSNIGLDRESSQLSAIAVWYQTTRLLYSCKPVVWNIFFWSIPNITFLCSIQIILRAIFNCTSCTVATVEQVFGAESKYLLFICSKLLHSKLPLLVACVPLADGVTTPTFEGEREVRWPEHKGIPS